MHPEVTASAAGKCPKCGMALVLKKESKESSAPKVFAGDDRGLGRTTWRSYIPLIVVIGIIILAAKAVSVHDLMQGTFAAKNFISYFMIGFFLTFSAFKLMDLKGFAEGYSTYDLLAMRVRPYGYVYPFIELFFGLAMILAPFSRPLLVAEIVVMVFSGLGVAVKIAKREPFMCACLGTFLKVPLTTVTLVEDFGMAALGLTLLLLK